jgi:cell fate regulator YaaT (PSP1 superfamily)
MPALASLKFSDMDLPTQYLAGSLEMLRPEEFVVAPRPNGEEEVALVAHIEWRPQEVLKHRAQALLEVRRRASEDEIAAWREARGWERRVVAHARERAGALKLDLKITKASCSLAQQRITVMFSSEAKVDFRALLKDLGAFTRMRVELWQIGMRDEARVVGGLGVCGLTTCCSTWLTEFRPISVKLARDQDLPLPPGKLVGQCGRFLCCLSYEVDQYRELSRDAHPRGATVRMKGKSGVIVDRNLIARTYVVRWEDGPVESIPAKDFKPEEVRLPEALRRGGPRKGGARNSREDSEPLADEAPPSS